MTYSARALACRKRRHALFLSLLEPLLTPSLGGNDHAIYKPTGARVHLDEHVNVGEGWMCRGEDGRLFVAHDDELTPLTGRPAYLLDVGGTVQYWNEMGGVPTGLIVTTINPEGDWRYEEGAWRRMGERTPAKSLDDFFQGYYDVAFSNSTLAYVGNASARADMAAQMQRIAGRVFLQTPNRWFPLDWRTCLPLFHWLPATWQARLMSWLPRSTLHHSWQHFGKPYAECLAFVRQVNDVDYAELRRIFPGATILRERVGPFTKSFLVHTGFDQPRPHPRSRAAVRARIFQV